MSKATIQFQFPGLTPPKQEKQRIDGPDLSDHGCEVCGAFGAYGYGNRHTGYRWRCDEHRIEMDAGESR